MKTHTHLHTQSPFGGAINNAYRPAGSRGSIDPAIKTLIYNSITGRWLRGEGRRVEFRGEGLHLQRCTFIEKRSSSTYYRHYQVDPKSSIQSLK